MKPEDTADPRTRYARAWFLYRDTSLDDATRQTLEQEMDSAQNHFTWAEFQEFKKTLPGYEDFWTEWATEERDQISSTATV